MIWQTTAGPAVTVALKKFPTDIPLTCDNEGFADLRGYVLSPGTTASTILAKIGPLAEMEAVSALVVDRSCCDRTGTYAKHPPQGLVQHPP